MGVSKLRCHCQFTSLQRQQSHPQVSKLRNVQVRGRSTDDCTSCLYPISTGHCSRAVGCGRPCLSSGDFFSQWGVLRLSFLASVPLRIGHFDLVPCLCLLYVTANHVVHFCVHLAVKACCDDGCKIVKSEKCCQLMSIW